MILREFKPPVNKVVVLVTLPNRLFEGLCVSSSIVIDTSDNLDSLHEEQSLIPYNRYC